MNKKDRLVQAYETLRAMGIVHTQVDIAVKMNSNKSSISQAMQGNERYLTSNFLLRFNHSFNGIFNDSWLLLGEGEMLAPKAVVEQTFNSGKNVNSGTATNVGDTYQPSSASLEEVVKQQSEQIGKLIDDNAKRSEQIDKLINMLAEKL